MSEPYYSDDAVTIHHGDCLDVLRELPDASVDAVVTDPPYSLSFMGREWDSHETPAGFQAWCQLWATECLRVLKPGGHLLAFGGTRTWHRLACAVEDAGFEVRDSIAWLYGSGFPKSLDVSKAIDKQRDDRDAVLAVTTFMADRAERQGITRAQVDAHMGTSDMGGWWLSRLRHRCACPTPEQYSALKALLSLPDDLDDEVMRLNGRKGTLGEAWLGAQVTGIREGAMSGWNMDGTTRFVDRQEKAPATDAARTWQGWGTALKPAHEPVVCARKPLAGTVAANVLAHGTGALNIGATRITTTDDLNGGAYRKEERSCTDGTASTATLNSKAPTTPGSASDMKTPSLDGPSSTRRSTGRHDGAESWRYIEGGAGEYVAPAGRWPANVILDESQAAELDAQSGVPLDALGSRFTYTAKASSDERVRVDGIAHPTVKPIALMRWLVRLVTPPGGTVLEPFAGSGTTVEACLLEGFTCIAIEREADYLPLIRQRINRRRDPVAAVKGAGEDGGLFDLLDGESA